MSIIENNDYNIYIGSLEDDFNDFLKKARNNYSSLFLLTDSNVYKKCLSPLNKKTNILGDVGLISIEAGEKNKTIESAIEIWQKLLEKNADKKSLLINFGGGLISDMGGFVAANFKRGIDFINIPTSLIGMADASIGGKTAVDFKSYKNQIGLFANPKAVFIDTDFLSSLPKEHIISGYGEIIKSALIDDLDFWNLISNENVDDIKNWDLFLKFSVSIKNKIVNQDQFESGKRKILNFGHTIGHAFETYALERNIELSHGHAIAIGIIAESYLSHTLLNLKKNELNQITETVMMNFARFSIDKKTIPTIIEIIKQDKKSISGKFNFSLIERIGQPLFDVKVDYKSIQKSIEYYLNC